MINLVQQKQTAATAGATTISVTLPSNTTTGNLLVFGITSSFTNNTGFGSSCSDGTNTFTKINESVTNADQEMWYAANITGGTTVVTLTFGQINGSSCCVWAREYSGVATTSPLDTNTTGSGGASPATLSFTTGQPYSLIVFYEGMVSSGNTFTAGASYGNLIQQSATPAQAIEDRIVNVQGAYTASITHSPDHSWEAGVAVFKGAAKGSFQPNNLRPHIFSPGLAR